MIYYFLPFIILLGLITSYQDIRFHKIKNIWVVYSIIVSIILNLVIFLKDVNTGYYSKFLINLILTIIVCIILWLYGFWPAGDAKLIIAYTFLLPITIYSLSMINYFSSVFLFINIFVPYTLFVLIYFVFFQTRKIKIIFKRINYKNLITSIFSIFIVMWPIDFVLSKLVFLNNFFVRIVLIILLYYILEYLIRKLFRSSATVYVILVLLRFWFQFDKIFTTSFLKIFLIYYIIFIFAKFFIIEIANISSTEVVKEKGKLVKKKKYLPFAPFAFLGIILTVLSGGTFINLFLFLFKYLGWL